MKQRNFFTRTGKDAKERSDVLNLLKSLLKYGKVETNFPNSKILRKFADRLISRAKTDGLATMRYLEKHTHDFAMAKKVRAYATDALKKRTSGFVSVKHAGIRIGDNSSRYLVTLLDYVAKKAPKVVKTETVKTEAKVVEEKPKKTEKKVLKTKNVKKS